MVVFVVVIHSVFKSVNVLLDTQVHFALSKAFAQQIHVKMVPHALIKHQLQVEPIIVNVQLPTSVKIVITKLIRKHVVQGIIT
jgi:hypothetical protein